MRTQEFPVVTAVMDRVYRIRTTDVFGKEVSMTVQGWDLVVEMLDIYREQGHRCRLSEETWVR